MNIFHAIVLGVVQGLTEFLPVSSSGHLIIFPEILGWGMQPLVFDTILHLGTGLALIIYFAKDLWEILTKDRKYIWFMLLGSIPAGALGYFMEDYIEQIFRGVGYVIVFLLLGSVMMLLAERSATEREDQPEKAMTKTRSFGVGLFQALALFPGFSRSGSTISGGILFGLSRASAARFSFLLSIPIVVGASLYKVVSSVGTVEMPSTLILVAGFFTSFAVGMFAIKFLLNFLKKNSLNAFILYRFALAIILIILT